MTSDGADKIGFFYALFLAAGGIYGASVKGSIISLVMGLGGGYIASVGANKVTADKHDVALSMSVSTVMMAVMGFKFVQSNRFFPAGIIMLVSLIVTCYYGLLLADLTDLSTLAHSEL